MKNVFPFTDDQVMAIRGALVLIAMSLPESKKVRRQRSEIREEAFEFISFDGDAGVAARETIKRFVDLCPDGYGTVRKKSWWVLLEKFFSDVEAQGMYFNGFPVELTDRQYDCMRAYIIERNVQVEAALHHLDTAFRKRSNVRFGVRGGIVRPYFAM